MRALTIASLLLSFIGNCQIKKTSVHQLKFIFKKTIDQPEKDRVVIGANAWIICNQDSAFFKTDTVKLYSNINYFYQKSNCCEFIKWTFYRKNKFTQSQSQICEEPPISSVKFDYCNIDFFSKKGKTYILVINKSNDQLFETIGLEEIPLADNGSSKVVILKRVTSK